MKVFTVYMSLTLDFILCITFLNQTLRKSEKSEIFYLN